MLKTHDNAHEIMQTTTRGSHNKKHANGLAQAHAYTVIGITEAVPGQRLVKMRNPWGKEGYTGPWCDECDEWNDVSQDVKDSLSFTSADDGVFYMTVEDYHAGFRETNINYDLSDGDWHKDFYLFLNDEATPDYSSPTEWCDGCTYHDFTLTNTATVAQKAYL